LAEPFKNLVSPALVRAAAQPLQSAWPAFDGERFTALAATGLEALELKARAMHVCAALEATLPADFATAADVIEAALAPVEAGVAAAGPDSLAEGLRGWILWPAGEYIARHGQSQPERALAALQALTQRFTAEFAIRPFIVQHPALVFATLQRWTADPSAQVRRLVSEGSRPRLPWGLRLQALVQDPSPTLPLLRHASRTLVKQGHPGVLQAWGLGAALRGEAALAVAPRRVRLGGEITLTLQLRSTSPRPQTLVIDYAVHHVKADGSRRPKVFKGWHIELPLRGQTTLAKHHSLRAVTTRRYHGGEHLLAVQINGRTVAEASFTLVMPKTAVPG